MSLHKVSAQSLHKDRKSPPKDARTHHTPLGGCVHMCTLCRPGEMLRQAAEQGMRAGDGNPKLQRSHAATVAPTLSEIGITKRISPTPPPLPGYGRTESSSRRDFLERDCQKKSPHYLRLESIDDH